MRRSLAASFLASRLTLAVWQTCHFASIDVSDMMGTERQGITKDITMTRLDAKGDSLGVVDYNDDQIEYEEIADTEGDGGECLGQLGYPTR